MISKRTLMKRIIILVVLLLIFVKGLGMNFTSIGAHKLSERTGHYGPSEIVHIEDFEGGKLFLCKYDKWFSCNTVNRSFLFFWRYGNQVHGTENDLSKPLSYSYGYSSENYRYYGIINDKSIAKIEIILRNEDKLSVEEFHDDMFLINWKAPADDRSFNFKGLKAYDQEGNIIFEDLNY